MCIRDRPTVGTCPNSQYQALLGFPPPSFHPIQANLMILHWYYDVQLLTNDRLDCGRAGSFVQTFSVHFLLTFNYLVAVTVKNKFFFPHNLFHASFPSRIFFTVHGWRKLNSQFSRFLLLSSIGSFWQKRTWCTHRQTDRQTDRQTEVEHSGLSTFKYLFSHNHWSHATLILVST